MPDFSLSLFTKHLLAETLLYDEEYGLAGAVSLVDAAGEKERYLASFMPDDGTFLIERATAWEDPVELDDPEDVAYRLATDSTVESTHDLPEEAAHALLELAEAYDLMPSFTLLFEDDEL
ncbi:hypothetical protein [Salisaeta longa]|uniref:hypothetical protein n=1 Tax=Salisaeta longa TaxID=503170 RepID=UPI0003B6333F|nr:hypothetical protein [Salisaeta longa]